MNVITRRNKPVELVLNSGKSGQKTVSVSSFRAGDLPHADLAVLVGREDFPTPKSNGLHGPRSSVVNAKRVDLGKVG